MAMPFFTFPFCLPQNVAHNFISRTFRGQAILRPVCKVLQIKRQVVLQQQAVSARLLFKGLGGLRLQPHRFCEIVQVDPIELKEVIAGESPGGGHKIDRTRLNQKHLLRHSRSSNAIARRLNAQNCYA